MYHCVSYRSIVAHNLATKNWKTLIQELVTV